MKHYRWLGIGAIILMLCLVAFGCMYPKFGGYLFLLFMMFGAVLLIRENMEKADVFFSSKKVLAEIVAVREVRYEDDEDGSEPDAADMYVYYEITIVDQRKTNSNDSLIARRSYDTPQVGQINKLLIRHGYATPYSYKNWLIAFWNIVKTFIFLIFGLTIVWAMIELVWHNKSLWDY